MSSSAAPYNITIDRGSDWSKVLTLSDNNGAPVAITNIFTVAISITGTTSPSVAAGSLTYVSTDLWSSNGNATAPGSGTWIRVRRSGGAWEITHWVAGVQSTGYWTSSSNPNHPAWVETWVAAAGATGSPVVDSAGMFFEGSVSLQERGPDVIPFSFDTVGDGSAGQVEISLSRSYTRALANSGAYRFDWFVYRGRERIRLVAGRITAQGSSTGTSTGIPIPAFGSSPSIAWGNITGTLSDQTDLQAALDAISSGASTFAELTDKATADLPAINTPLASALSGKQPLDADLTAIAALTTTANGRALLTSANALTIGASASVSGTNTGDQDLSGYTPLLSSMEVNGIGSGGAFGDALFEDSFLTVGKRSWTSAFSELYYTGTNWNFAYSNGANSYQATIASTSDEPWKLGGWTPSSGTGDPSFVIYPSALQPVNNSGTIALATDQQGRVSPADMIGFGSGVFNGLISDINNNGGFLTAGTGGTLPITRGGTGATTAGLARIALGSGATGDELFTAATPAAARTTLGIISRVTTADVFATSTTPVAIPELTFPVEAGKHYRVDANLVIQSQATPGYQLTMTYPNNARTGLGYSSTLHSANQKIPTLAATSMPWNPNTTGNPNNTIGVTGYAYLRPTASGNVTFTTSHQNAGGGSTGPLTGSLITVTEL